MTTARRLARVEAALTPGELVRRWLAEAHASDDFAAYSRAVYAQGPEALPLDRLVRDALAGADARLKPRERKPGGPTR